MQGRNAPPFFSTKTNPAEAGDVDPAEEPRSLIPMDYLAAGGATSIPQIALGLDGQRRRRAPG